MEKMEQEENNTNLNNTQQQEHEQRTNSTRSPPVASVSSVVSQPRTANIGLPRRRIKWTTEMNVSVLRAYFRSTRDESIISYRQQMYNYFLIDHPELGHITLQNLADRRAAIIRNNLIPTALQEEIRQSVLREILPTNNYQQPQQQNYTNTMAQIETISENIPNQVSEEVQEENTPITQINSPTYLPYSQFGEILDTIKDIFNEAKVKYLDMEQQSRPYLPKQKPCKKTQQITSIVNTEVLPTEIPLNADYDQLIGIIYCSAYTILQTVKLLQQGTPRSNTNRMTGEELNNISRQRNNPKTPRSSEIKPIWQIRLQQKIDEIRKDLGYITSHMNRKTGKRSKHKLRKIERKYKFHTQFDCPNRTIEQIRDTIRQKLTKYTTRLRSYTKSYNRSKHNKLFQTNEKQFYNTIAKPPGSTTTTSNAINIEEIEKFWKAIWSEKRVHNLNATWIQTVNQSVSSPTMNTNTISSNVLKKAIAKLHNWKQPGVDKIHNYYYKYLTTTHPHIIRIFNSIIVNPNVIQPEMCTGITYLKPKCQNPTTASQYRPITCLNTGYKLLTSCLTIIITEFCESNNVLAEEQKGCRQGTRGCKDQLIIDSVIATQALRNKKNLYTAFIDYQKAFDSVPHSWLLETLRIYKINPTIIHCIGCLMNYWKTTLQVREGNKNVTSQPIHIQRGICQGDSLSPLLFCLALNPLSLLLKRSEYGYKLKTSDPYRISHCFYMDDLKLYANTKQRLKSLIQIVETFTIDIQMKFGIDKCRTQNVSRGKYSTSENIFTREGEEIAPLRRDEYYKFLGIKQRITIDHTKQKKETETQFAGRVYDISKSYLNGRNLIKALNTYAIPLLTYTFGILHWSSTDLANMDRKMRTILTKTKHHHPKSSIERINIPRKLGGRGLLNIQMLHDWQIQNLVKYFTMKATTSILYRSIVNADDKLTPLNLKNNSNVTPQTTQNLINSWKSKPLHGKYPNYIYQQHIDLEKTNNWLLFSNLFSETEGFIIAIQDGVIPTKNYRKYIIHDSTITEDKCRRCGTSPETIQHLLNNCTALTANHYKQRHDNVGKIVHAQILKILKISKVTTSYYKYTPQPIIENQKYTIYWDRSILVHNPPETTIPNRPDMIIIDKEEKTARIIDFAVPFDNNIQDTINTKKTKYHQLSEYLKNTQNLKKIDIIPIIISSLGTIPKETTESIEKLNLKTKIITEMQKAVLIRAATIMRETIGERI